MPPSHAICLSCGRSEDEFPVLVLRLSGREVHICPQCLPALIHHPDRLTEKLLAAGMQPGQNSDHDEHA